MKLGYARVCSTDPNLTVQRYTLSAAGCDTINQEKSMNGRTQLEAILAFIRPGDALVVTRIDRLARNIGDLQVIVRRLAAKGASLKAIDQPIDTGTAAGKLFRDMLGCFAEFETNVRRERQLEGIAKAKAAGVYAGKGRPAKIEADKIRRLKADGLGATAIAKELGICRASVYRATRCLIAPEH